MKVQFAHPWVLGLLVVPVALVLWEWQRRGHVVRAPFDHAGRPRGRWLGRLVNGASSLPAMVLAAALLLLARPQRSDVPKDERLVTNIQFCMDVSGSMTEAFGDGNRADGAIRALQDFTRQRPGDAFGLTIFGSDVLHWVPVTRDLSALRLAAPFLRPEKMPRYMAGTRIGKALQAVKTVLASKAEGDRMIILVSDGESQDLLGGQAEEIGHELSREGIVVYYIHVAQGQPQEETFTIARLTGGAAFAAGDPAALKEVFRKIDGMQKARLRPAAPEWVDDYRWVSAGGLVLLGLHLLAALGLRYTPW
ncbi:MAG: vWA domain-containing protein [Verrucomicrobiota bacterium]